MPTITQSKILGTDGKAIEANDDGATLANGDYFVDLGGDDTGSVHLESKDAVLAGEVKFFTSNRNDAPAHLTPGWGEETRLGTVTFAAAIRTEVVSVLGNRAAHLKAWIHVTAPGKLLVLRRGGL